MGVMKMNSYLSRSCDNFGTVLKTDGGLGLWRYPTRGQYYVNINVLSARGAVSLDAEGWRELVAAPRESNDSVYEPVTRVSSPHSYVREYVPEHSGIWNYPCGDGLSRAGVQTFSDVHDEGVHRRGASKLLRSLKRFKQKLMATKPKKCAEPQIEGKLGDATRNTQSVSSGNTCHKEDSVPKIVKTLDQGFPNHLKNSVDRATVRQSNKLNRLPPSHRETNSHTYPDIIKSHNDPRTDGTGPRKDNTPTIRQSANSKQGRKCNLKRQTVIRLPSNDKPLQTKPGLQEMQSFRHQVHQHMTSSNKAVRCANDPVTPRDRDSPFAVTNAPLHSTLSSRDAVTTPRNEELSHTYGALSPPSRNMSPLRRAMTPSEWIVPQSIIAMPQFKAMPISTTDRTANMSPSKERVMSSSSRSICSATRKMSATSTMSPTGRTQSPTRAISSKSMPSPTRRARSPTKGTLSLTKRSMSPTGRFASTTRTMSPTTRTMSPTRSMSPARRRMSPTGAMSPSRRAMFSTGRTMSATRAISPGRGKMSHFTSMSPTRRTMSPTKPMSPTTVASPRRGSMPPMRTRSPKRTTSPTRTMSPTRAMSPGRGMLSPMSSSSSPCKATSLENSFQAHRSMSLENRNVSRPNLKNIPMNSVDRTVSSIAEADYVYLGSGQMNTRSSVENQQYHSRNPNDLEYTEFNSDLPLHRSSTDDRKTPSVLPSYQETMLRTKTLPKAWRMTNNLYPDQPYPSTTGDCCEPCGTGNHRPCDRQASSTCPAAHNRHLINYSRSYSHLDGYKPGPEDRQPLMINSQWISLHPKPTLSSGEPGSAGLDVYRDGRKSSSNHSSSRRRRRDQHTSRSYDIQHTVPDKRTPQASGQHRLSVKSADSLEILI